MPHESLAFPAQTWWIGVEGTQLTTADRRRLHHPAVSGVVLFARNGQTRQEVAALTAAIRAERPSLAIAVDHEGGRVQRFRGEGFTRLPPMAEVGKQWADDPAAACAEARRWGEIAGAELAACGVTVNFAPVVDLDDGKSRVIGDRAFGHDPEAVAALAIAFAEGLLAAGIVPVFKHFPGHGGVVADSHVELPVDPRPMSELWGHDLLPYRRWVAHTSLLAAAGTLPLAGVMAALVSYPVQDQAPAAFSSFWVRCLRERVEFTGPILSDDLGMAAAAWAGATLAERGAAFFAAGGDVALACNDFAAIDALLHSL